MEDRGTNPLLLAILGEEPNRVWRVEELLTEMNRRGWETDAVNRRNALGTALLRLAKKDDVEKVGRGRYRAALHDSPEVEGDTPTPLDAAEQEPPPEGSRAVAATVGPEAPLWSQEANMGS
jgi:hypothetical protein